MGQVRAFGRCLSSAVRSVLSDEIRSLESCILMHDPGAFGSGAAFALEDGWILARAIEYTRAHSLPTRDALAIVDEIRSPYYKRM